MTRGQDLSATRWLRGAETSSRALRGFALGSFVNVYRQTRIRHTCLSLGAPRGAGRRRASELYFQSWSCGGLDAGFLTNRLER